MGDGDKSLPEPPNPGLPNPERASPELADPEQIRIFEQARPRLLGLAYRILGSRADAEDAVQDTFEKWAKAERRAIENASAWLTTACTRRCLDLLRAAHRSRVDYVGAWLPEPIQSPAEAGAEQSPEQSLQLAASLSTAFLLLLERLTPKERAAYLLHEIFERPYPEVAEALAIKEATCRRLVSRAKAHVEQAKVRHRTPLERQDQLLAAFQSAITGGQTAPLAALLSKDIQLSADGGGKVPALLEVLRGKAEVMAFLSESLRDFWAGFAWVAADINGKRGFLLKSKNETVAAVSFAYDEAGRASAIYIVRNPDKLARLDAAAIH